MAPDWELIYAAHYRRLVVLVAATTGSVPEAEEAVQEAFARALSPLRARNSIDDPLAWLYGVAVNVARSRWRRLLVAQRHRQRDATPSVDRFEGHVETRLTLLAALRELPAAQREALALHYLADMSVEAIAIRIGAPEGTVKARLSRGREALGVIFAGALHHERTPRR
ncbi:MAG: RNA polymerase sigma factor [Mycobacteriales bacterium]